MSPVINISEGGAVAPAPITDEFFANVVLLTHLDADPPVDVSNSGHTLTVAGSAARDTTDKKFGDSSYTFSADGDQVEAADSSDWDFGSGEWTVECWVRFDSAPSGSDDPVFVSQFLNTGNQRSWMFWLQNGSLDFTYTTDGSSQVAVGDSWSPSSLTWYFLAACRVGNEIIVYIDGVEHARETHSVTFFDGTGLLTIGAPDNATVNHFQRNIDEVRITKGVGRYSTNFTPPTLAFPDS